MNKNTSELLNEYNFEQLYKIIKKAKCGNLIIAISSILCGLILWIYAFGFAPNILLSLLPLISGMPFISCVPNVFYKKHFKNKLKKDYPDIIYYNYTYNKRCQINFEDLENLYITKDYKLINVFDETVDLKDPYSNSLTKALKVISKDLDKVINDMTEDIENLDDEYKNKDEDPQTVNNNTNINININGINLKILTNENQKFNWAIGREKELDILLEDLYSRKTNPILVGAPGVGKTSLVKGLAYKIQKNEVPEIFKNKEIYALNINDLVSGTIYRGSFEGRLKKFINFAQDKNKIFLMDEIHSIIGAGNSSNQNLDAANILKPYLEDGSINVIGATTKEEYERYILSDKAFSSRFEKIVINEPDDKTLYIMVKENIKFFENEYKVKFMNEQLVDTVIKSLIELTSKRHRNYQDMEYNPRLVVKILDKAFVKCKLRNGDFVNLNDVCEAIKSNSKLYTPAKNKTINALSGDSINKDKTKVIQVDFGK